eukprot:5773898-Prymnesium_polylepis.1
MPIQRPARRTLQRQPCPTGDVTADHPGVVLDFATPISGITEWLPYCPFAFTDVSACTFSVLQVRGWCGGDTDRVSSVRRTRGAALKSLTHNRSASKLP